MLAYSSIAHAGYLLIAVASPIASGVQSAGFYLVSYTFMTMGAFVVASIVGRSGGEGEDGYTLSAYAGLGRRRPALAAAMTIFLLSLTGIPPCGGFVGKLYIFRAAFEGKMYVLATIGVLNAVIGAYYYLLPIVAMWMDPEAEGPGPAPAERANSLAIAACVLGTLVLGVYPAPLLELARELYLSLI
jgi:NADH-quinone oxidoreductase subunit N